MKDTPSTSTLQQQDTASSKKATPKSTTKQKKKHHTDKEVGPTLTIKINKKFRHVRLAELLNSEALNQLEIDCRRAGKIPVFFLDNLLDYAERDRWTLLEFLAGLERYRIAVGEGRFANIFDAALDLLVDTNDLKSYQRAKGAALEAAVLLYAEALEGACARIVDRLRQLGVKGIKIANLLSDARKIQKALQHRPVCAESGEQRVRAVFPDAPVPESVTIPSGWRLSPQGVERNGANDKEAKLVWPVILTALSHDAHRQTQAVTLAWLRDGKWHQRVVDREVVASTRSVIELAALGLPVHSNNAWQFVAYVADFEAHNLDKLPVTKFSRQMGWQGGIPGEEGFLWGTKLVTAAGSLSSPSTDSGALHVHFRGADEGDDQVADGFCRRGKWSEWRQAVEPLADYPAVRLAIYASLCPPMLSILETANFILGFSGRTSIGKTTTLRVAASVWGDPDEHSRRGAALSTWDGTAVWRERAPAALNNLPFILDDTKRAKSGEEVARTIYEVAQGRGRGRGSVKGLARQQTWQTVLLTSGEQPTTSFTRDAGTRARVLEYWGSPFATTDETTIALVRQLNKNLMANFGHAGPRFLRYLLKNREEWQKWRDGYAHCIEKYEDMADGQAVAGRMAAHFAALTVTAKVAHYALQLPWNYANPIVPLWEMLIQEATHADQGAEALRHVMAWAHSNQMHFFGRGEEKRPPLNGWAGRWESKDVNLPGKKKKGLWGWIGFFEYRLNDILVKGGYVSDAILRDWKARSWLVLDAEADGVVRNQHKTRIGSESVRLVAITRQAVKEVQAL